MTRPYLISTIVQIHAREASVAQRLRSNGVLGIRRDGENKSLRLEVVVTRLDPRHESPDGADGYA